MQSVLLGIVLCLLVSSGMAVAHNGLERQIADATANIIANPLDAQALLFRAELHRLHRDWTAASADLDAAERLSPDHEHLERIRIHVDFDRGLAPEACAGRMKTYLQKRPQDIAARLLYAEILDRIGQRALAIDQLDFVLSDPKSLTPDLALRRFRWVHSLGAEQDDRALEGLDHAVKKLGAVPALVAAAIELELEHRRYDAALDRLQQSSLATSPLYWIRRGDILHVASRLDEAQRAYAQARTLLVSARRQTPQRKRLIEYVEKQLAASPESEELP